MNIRGLLRAEAFPHPVTRIELRETHISWVVLTGEFAYKIKKPVRFDFLDATDLERRHLFCEEELRLNRRTAPELYLAVLPITRDDTGKLKVDGRGTPVEYAVQIRQFAAADELAALLDTDSVTLDDMTQLAADLAAFHDRAAVAAPDARQEQTAQTYDTVLGNLNEVATLVDPHRSRNDIRQLVDWTLAQARALRQPLALRASAGFVRECHGDLHAGNIVRSNARLVPFDCIEFDPALRFIDVMSDVAFLVMDLAVRRHEDLAFALLSRYLEIAGGYDGLRLLPFYAVYRALVRAKVDALAAAGLPARAAEFRHRLEKRVAAAVHWMSPAAPRLTIMHGLSGSGKSWLSERLVPVLRAVRIRSDNERKRLAGAPGTHLPAAFGEGLYTPAMSQRTYTHLFECAESGLSARCNVIVDAAFLQAADREPFRRLAQRMHAHYTIVSCEAAPAILAARIVRRASAGHDPSDATAAVLAEQVKHAQPFANDEQPHVISVRTSGSDAVESVVARMGVRD